MHISETKLLDIVPEFMKDDKTVRGLCAAGNVMLNKLMDMVKVSWWRKYINVLPEKRLDEIAHLLNISWYDDGADPLTKREIIHGYDNILYIAGTPLAVENAVRDIFGAADVVEWPDYDGEPYHFKLQIGTQLTDENTSQFQEAVNSSKNVRSIMDSVETARRETSLMFTAGKFNNLQICETR